MNSCVRTYLPRSGLLSLAAAVLMPSVVLAAPVSGKTDAAVTRTARIEDGSIKGRVTEEGSGAPVAGAQVVVVGTRLGAVAGGDGNYVIRGVPAGTVQVRAIRIGFQPTTQSVTVTDGGEATANFSLTKSIIQLEAVVTTATGEQSRKSVGDVVASVRVDSLVGQQPLTSVNDALTARTAGVQV
jgi:TonB-dependent starch-binding outer membrane protein SusC